MDLVQVLYAVEDDANISFTDDGLGTGGESQQRLAVVLGGRGWRGGREEEGRKEGGMWRGLKGGRRGEGGKEGEEGGKRGGRGIPSYGLSPPPSTGHNTYTTILVTQSN